MLGKRWRPRRHPSHRGEAVIGSPPAYLYGYSYPYPYTYTLPSSENENEYEYENEYGWR